MQVTLAVAVPAFVRDPTFQVHDTSPFEPAVGVGFSPAAAETLPEGQVTVTEHVAPGVVFAVRVAVAPGTAGAGRLMKRTEIEPASGRAVGRGVGAGVRPGAVVAAARTASGMA